MRFRVTWTLFLCFVALSCRASEIVTACGHHDYPPWNWKRGDEIVGACAEIVRRAFEPLGVKVSTAFVGPWKRCQASVESGRVDVNMCAFLNRDRAAYSKFMATPVAHTTQAAFVPVDRPIPFTRWSDLAGRRIVMERGVSMGEAFDVFVREHAIVHLVNDRRQAFRMLEAGRADLLATGRQIGNIQVALYGYQGRIVALPTPIERGPLYISISDRSRFHHLLAGAERFLQSTDYPALLDELLNRYRRLYLEERSGATGNATPVVP